MGVHSGKFGVVSVGDVVSGVRNWNVTDSVANQAYVASNTRGGTNRKGGIADWSGSYNAYGGIPAVLPGDEFTFTGYTAPDNDVSGEGTIYTGQAIVDSVSIVWSWDQGQIIAHTVNFSAVGALTEDAGTLEDISTTEPESSLEGAKIVFVGIGSVGSGDDEICNLLNATLNLTSANTAYANSCTDGHMARKEGNKDWTLSFAMQDNTRRQLSKAQVVELAIYVNDTDYWHLQWGIIANFTGLTVDAESGAIINQTINVEMKGLNEDAVGVVEVGATQWWPTVGSA